MGESRNDLINWLNGVTGLGLTKVEQCGTGAAYCQLMDSIFGNHPNFIYDFIFCVRG